MTHTGGVSNCFTRCRTLVLGLLWALAAVICDSRNTILCRGDSQILFRYFDNRVANFWDATECSQLVVFQKIYVTFGPKMPLLKQSWKVFLVDAQQFHTLVFWFGDQHDIFSACQNYTNLHLDRYILSKLTVKCKVPEGLWMGWPELCLWGACLPCNWDIHWAPSTAWRERKTESALLSGSARAFACYDEVSEVSAYHPQNRLKGPHSPLSCLCWASNPKACGRSRSAAFHRGGADMSRGGEKIGQVRLELVTLTSLQLIRWWEVVTFYSLRLAMAPVIETVILLDRYQTYFIQNIPTF